jgi:PiT family inorganic phosphate transporter
MNATLAAVDSPRPNLDAGLGDIGLYGFLAVMITALGYVGYSVYTDAVASGADAITFLPFFMLFVALLIALGFEFVNGFHDTANAVATVIYTHSLPAHVAVVISGFFNFLGVLVSTGVVAYTIISLLPVELILQVGSNAGFAMVFALLIAAVIWNLGTWYLGLPSSSSHTLIGSVIGVGVANALLHGRSGTSGVDWEQAWKVGQALMFSPLIGFGAALVLFVALKTLIRIPALYKEPVGDTPPPWWIRLLLVSTCAGVSFGHGSNDGQKGMGLIMLILIGIVPTAYALNKAVPAGYVAQYHTASVGAEGVFVVHTPNGVTVTGVDAARAEVTRFIADRKSAPGTLPAMAVLTRDVDGRVQSYGSLAKVPAAVTRNVRNDMYLISSGLKRLAKDKTAGFTADQTKALSTFDKSLDQATRFIPIWVKVAVAIALGLGTMIGWKRVVVTVGEKIGKQHLTYAQGMVAEIVTTATIFGADAIGVPVSTTHILTSGVAGTMSGNGSGLQWSTVRNMATAWVLTLPVSILLSAVLYVGFSRVM